MCDVAYVFWERDVRFIHRNICFYRLVNLDPNYILARILKSIEKEVMLVGCQL